MLANIILAVQMLSALGMVGLVLIQHGKGADMGAAFGSGGLVVCSAQRVGRISCRAARLLWRQYFLSLRWPWLIWVTPGL